MPFNEHSTWKECGHRVIWGQINKNGPIVHKPGDVIMCHQCGAWRTIKTTKILPS